MVFALLLVLGQPAFACKVAVNLQWSKGNVERLLKAAAEVGPFPGFSIARIENGIPATRIELRNGSGACKALVIAASQPGCQVEYKFRQEEDCK